MITAKIGQVSYGPKIGYKSETSFIWAACVDCGKERWVQLLRGEASRLKCLSCSRKKPVVERFWAKVKKVDSGCWEWQAGLQGSGYGLFCPTHKQKVPAHRFAYELLRGSIPEGLKLDHLCRNRICVNPSHLEPVTLRENILRGVGPAAINGRKTHCLRGHPLTDENVYLYKGMRHCRICGRIRDNKWRQKHKKRIDS